MQHQRCGKRGSDRLNKSKIEWCDYTWNPVTGCLHGCDYCYARRIAERFGLDFAPNLGDPGMGGAAKYDSPEGLDTMLELEIPYVKGGRVQPYPMAFLPTFHRYRLNEPTRKTKGAKIFVSSMGDLFGDWVPDEWIEKVFKSCEAAPQHNYMFLTKNPKRYGQLNGKNHRYDWSFVKENWWFGITVTRQENLRRLRYLPYGATNTFLSIEPLLDEIDLSFYIPKQTTKCKCSYCGHHADYYSSHCQYCGKEGGYSGSFRMHPIDWIIIGAQTGPGAISPKKEWVQAIISQARAAGIPVFLKDNLHWPERIQEWPLGLK
jgi:protein gp37